MRNLRWVATALLLIGASTANAQVGVSVGVGYRPGHYYRPYGRGYWYGGYWRPWYPGVGVGFVVPIGAPVVAPPPTVVVQPAPTVATPPPPLPPPPPPTQVVPAVAPRPPVASNAMIDRYIQHLGNPDEAARTEAVLQLGRLQAVQAVGPLTQVLTSDRSPQVREAAARGLGLIGTRSALPALEQAAQADDDREVRKSARYAVDVIRSRNP